jgi:hypothetical protein
MPEHTFRLITPACQQLERHELTLHDHGVRAGSTIDAQLRVAGGGPKKTLYHQTDRDGLRGIKSAGGMRKGASGLAGPGIYFADTPEHTSHKARRRGVILEALVDIGERTLRIAADGCADAEDRMRAADCHSVLIPRSNGQEYCVYDAWRVTITRYHADGRWHDWHEHAGGDALGLVHIGGPFGGGMMLVPHAAFGGGMPPMLVGGGFGGPGFVVHGGFGGPGFVVHGGFGGPGFMFG